jgi:hypothetical protein
MIVTAETNTGTNSLLDSYMESVPTIPLLTSTGNLAVPSRAAVKLLQREDQSAYIFAWVLPEGAGLTGCARPP